MLRALADDLATAGPDRRAEGVANALRVGLPQTLGILADLLVDRLGSRSARARHGAAEALVGLGLAALGALKRAARTARGVVRVEGLLQDLAGGRVPDVLAERGWGAEWEHNRAGLVGKVLVGAAVVAIGAGLLAALRARSDSSDGR